MLVGGDWSCPVATGARPDRITASADWRQLGASGTRSRLRATDTPFVFLTNNSEQTPIDLVRKLGGLGITGLTTANFITSAMAAARFVSSQKPHGSAFVDAMWSAFR